MKTVDLNVRPIRHRLENGVRAHIFMFTVFGGGKQLSDEAVPEK